MTGDDSAKACPDCDAPLAFAFGETSGLGAWKRGDGFNTVPDTAHYVCFPCEKAWKQRLNGPLTPDIVGDLAFFSCRRPECGARLTVRHTGTLPTDVVLGCEGGHRYAVTGAEDDGLVLVDRR